MPILNSLADAADELAEWRRDLHRHPEILFDVHRTAGIVAERLKEFGCDEVVSGIGRTGVVGVINGRGPGTGVGLRADMDALSIVEETGKPYASTIAGKMHACGHDGHTTMLLAAARHLAATRNFNGRAILIFQPSEEGGTGAQEMVASGMLDRFGVDEVYALHNMPGLPIGAFATRPGPLMAASNQFWIELSGRGSHAAAPHLAVDTVLIGAEIIVALQAIVARNVDPVDQAVVSVAMAQIGDTFNILPARGLLRGTCRAMELRVLDLLEARVEQISTAVAAMHGGTAKVRFWRDSPATVSSEGGYAHAVDVAKRIAGAGNVNANCPPALVAEDFAYMLEARPGAFVFIGNGDSAGLHHPAYDFDDRAIPHGASWLVGLVEGR